jgi:hypothetical protein
VILTEPSVAVADLEQRAGWTLKPEGLCKGDLCVPLPPGASEGGRIDATVLDGRLGMPLLHDAREGLWALGPESVGGRTLTTAVAPELVLPDLDGRDFSLSSLRGRKVVLVAWASW